MDLMKAGQLAAIRAALFLLKASGAYRGYWNTWRGPAFDDGERMGLHIMPAHYYSPIPNVSRLPETAWKERDEIHGIDLRVPQALELVRGLADEFAGEYSKFKTAPAEDRRAFTLANKGFGAGDAEILYAMLRRFRPKRVIEVGCGNSTLAAAMALAENRKESPGAECRWTCVEPFLPDYLSPLPDPGMDALEVGIETLPLTYFECLGEGDFLFIDSTHVAAFGSDVVREYLEIIPRLKPGVIIHIHDIFFPRDYPQDWLKQKRFFWNEQYLLQALLLGNGDFEILLPLHALFIAHRKALAAMMPSLSDASARPSSFWMKKKA